MSLPIRCIRVVSYADSPSTIVPAIVPPGLQCFGYRTHSITFISTYNGAITDGIQLLGMDCTA